jgi:hypothetical protein
MAPRTKAPASPEPALVLSYDEARLADELDPADGEEVLHWLETGEGDPWRESSD